MAFEIAVLLSGNGSNLQAIIDAIYQNNLSVRIKIVISDRLDAKGLERAKQANITTAFIEPAKYQTRQQFDDTLSDILQQNQISLIVLAGFMRILSEKFVNNYIGQLINIHPSLLPKYKGLNTHQRVLEAGDSKHGASVHFVTPELDDGPVILQSSLDVLNTDDQFELKQKIHKIEHIIYPKAISWISSGRIKLKNNQVFFDDALLTPEKKLYTI